MKAPSYKNRAQIAITTTITSWTQRVPKMTRGRRHLHHSGHGRGAFFLSRAPRRRCAAGLGGPPAGHAAAPADAALLRPRCRGRGRRARAARLCAALGAAPPRRRFVCLFAEVAGKRTDPKLIQQTHFDSQSAGLKRHFLWMVELRAYL